MHAVSNATVHESICACQEDAGIPELRKDFLHAEELHCMCMLHASLFRASFAGSAFAEQQCFDTGFLRIPVKGGTS